MTEGMTDIAREVIRLGEAATPGEWEVRIYHSGGRRHRRYVHVEGAQLVAQMYEIGCTTRNAELIAYYRNHAEALAREVLRLSSEVTLNDCPECGTSLQVEPE